MFCIVFLLDIELYGMLSETAFTVFLDTVFYSVFGFIVLCQVAHNKK